MIKRFTLQPAQQLLLSSAYERGWRLSGRVLDIVSVSVTAWSFCNDKSFLLKNVFELVSKNAVIIEKSCTRKLCLERRSVFNLTNVCKNNNDRYCTHEETYISMRADSKSSSDFNHSTRKKLVCSLIMLYNGRGLINKSSDTRLHRTSDNGAAGFLNR